MYSIHSIGTCRSRGWAEEGGARIPGIGGPLNRKIRCILSIPYYCFFVVVFVCFLFLFFCFFLFLDQISIIKTNMVKAEGYAYIIESLKPCYARVHAQSKALVASETAKAWVISAVRFLTTQATSLTFTTFHCDAYISNDRW